LTSENAERVLYACIPLDRGGSVNRLPLRSSRPGGYWSYLLLRRRDLFVPRIPAAARVRAVFCGGFWRGATAAARVRADERVRLRAALGIIFCTAAITTLFVWIAWH
jgi:hypothetical protein